MKEADQIYDGMIRKPFSLKRFYKEHRIGILGTAVFHLLLLLIFLLVKISDYQRIENLDVYIDFAQTVRKTPEEIAAEQKKKEEEAYYQRLLKQQLNESNRAVNVSRDLEKKISTKDYVEQVEKELESSRSKEYLNEQEKIKKILNQRDVVPVNKPPEKKKEGQEYHGPTNITYRFTEPPLDRKTLDLPVPVYKCLGYGTVDVQVTVDQTGSVISAKPTVVNASTDPECLSEVAEKYARRTIFQGNLSAPAAQQAVITYQFVAQ